MFQTLQKKKNPCVAIHTSPYLENKGLCYLWSGYCGYLTVVTGQAVPLILVMLEVMFLVNRRGLCLLSPFYFF